MPPVPSDAAWWNALNKVKPQQPGQELAYAENVTGAVQALGTVLTDLVGCSIFVPQSDRPVWVDAEFWLDVTTAPVGTGNAGLNVLNEAGAVLGGCLVPLESTSNAGFAVVHARFRIPPGTPAGTIRAAANRSGVAYVASVMHGAIGPAFRSYIAAVEH